MLDRMLRTFRLDQTLAPEVVRDGAFSQAFLVVLVVAIASAIGTGGSIAISGLGLGDIASIAIGSAIGLFIGWAIAAAIYYVSARLLGGTGSFGGMMTSLGFAYAPGVLAIFGFIPFLGGLIALVGSILVIVNIIFAIKGSQNLTTGRAIVAWILPSLIIGALLCCLFFTLGTAILTAIAGLGVSVPAGLN